MNETGNKMAHPPVLKANGPFPISKSSSSEFVPVYDPPCYESQSLDEHFRSHSRSPVSDVRYENFSFAPKSLLSVSRTSQYSSEHKTTASHSSIADLENYDSSLDEGISDDENDITIDNEYVIKQALQEINEDERGALVLQNLTLSAPEAKTISAHTVSQKCKRITIAMCTVVSGFFGELVSSNGFQVETFEYIDNRGLTGKILEQFGSCLMQLQVSRLNLGGFSLNDLKALVGALGGYKVKSLIYDHNRNTSGEHIRLLSQLLHDSEITELSRVECQLNLSCMTQMKNSLGLKKIKMQSINLSLNETLCEECMGLLGDLLRLCSVERLTLQACYLTREKLEAFIDTLEQGSRFHLREIDFSHNPSIDASSMNLVTRIAALCRTSVLRMAGCCLDIEKITELCENLHKCEVKSLDLGRNPYLCELSMKKLGEEARKKKIERITFDNCQLGAEEINALANALHGEKIKSIRCHEPKMCLTDDVQDLVRMFQKIADECDLVYDSKTNPGFTQMDLVTS